MDFFTITTLIDCIFHRIYQIPFHQRVWPLVQITVTIGNSIPSLCIFTIWRVAGWQRSIRRHTWIRIQNGPPLIINRSSPGGGLRGGVFQKCSDIYTLHPIIAPDQGMRNRYFLLRETPRRWRARMHEWFPFWGWGLLCCLLNAYTAARPQGADYEGKCSKNAPTYTRSTP